MMPLLERGCQDQNAARRVTPLTFAHWQCVFSVLPGNGGSDLMRWIIFKPAPRAGTACITAMLCGASP
jgi:hypothetical protein